MNIDKPSVVCLTLRTFEANNKFYQNIAISMFLPLGMVRLLPEATLWPFLAENLPAGSVIDSCQPKTTPEFLATATAFAPRGQPVRTLRAGIRLGSIIKTLDIIGDRVWDGKTASSRTPFTTMPIIWQRAYGGPDTPQNPVGRGDNLAQASRQNPVPLPNIAARRPTTPPRQPAGFGPLDITWPQRATLAGTYDEDWLHDHFPGFPPDMDWRHFNLAPADQHFTAPLTGTEPYAFENLHPEHPLITGNLPGIAPRLFIRRRGNSELQEVPLALTTVWFFPDKDRMVLIHHGRTQLAEEDAADIETVLAGADPVGALRPAAAFAEALRLRGEPGAAAAARTLDDGLLVPRAWLAPDAAAQAREAEQAAAHATRRARQLRVHQKLTAQALEAGVDPDQIPEPPADEKPPSLEELPAFLEAATAKMEAAKQKIAALAPPGPRPQGPPAFSAHLMRGIYAAEAAKYRAMGAIAPQVEAALNDPATQANWEATERKLREGYRLTAHHQDKASPASAARSAELRGWLSGDGKLPYDMQGAELSGLNLAGRQLAGLCLDGASLADANLAGANLSYAVLAHANLRGANLHGANLASANLGQADLTGADCRGTNLNNAILTGATLANATLAGANLTGAELKDTNLAAAACPAIIAPSLLLIKTPQPAWQAAGAILTGASFFEIDLSGADFSQADLRGALFIACRLDGANFSGAILANAAFGGHCIARSAQFANANLAGANLRGARLTDCEFTGANLAGADFTAARMDRALLGRVRATDAVFTSANLAGADLNHGNFQGADFARADLRGTDLTNAGCTDANLPRVRLNDATKLAGIQSTRMRVLPRLDPP